MARTERRVASRSLRLFFALWPGETVRAELSMLAGELAQACGGRATAGGNLHITLAFLGNVPQERVPEFTTLAEGLSASPFELALDRLGYWRHNRIVWAAPQSTPPELRHLAAALDEGLRGLGWPVDERTYSPHVTLLRDARRGPTTQEASLPPWPVSDFALVSSLHDRGGVRYTPLRRWPLRLQAG